MWWGAEPCGLSELLVQEEYTEIYRKIRYPRRSLTADMHNQSPDVQNLAESSVVREMNR